MGQVVEGGAVADDSGVGSWPQTRLGAPLPHLGRGTDLRELTDTALQVALVAGAALLYFAVRGLTEGTEAVAVANGWQLLDFERGLGIDVEARAQQQILGNQVLVMLANWVYIWGHWPVIAVTLLWLYRHRRHDYLLLSRAMFISGGIGLVIFASYPVAPPRLMPGGPWVDTVTEFSTSYRVLQPPSLVNKYAALPSLHVGWNLLVGVAVYRISGSRALRTAAVAGPVLMVLAVVLTGNHYVVDAVLGTVVALIGLALAHVATRRPVVDDPKRSTDGRDQE